MRKTRQKELIFNIVDNSYNHPTTNDVYVKCQQELPEISLATVYRNLNFLADNGLIKRIKMPDNIDRFDNRHYDHPHFICVKCASVMDLEDGFSFDVDSLNSNKILDYEINVRGICEKCLKKEGEI